MQQTKPEITPLHFRIDGEGPPLLLIHGVGADLRSWDAAVPLLSPHYRVIRADLRGHGESPLLHEPYSLERFAADLIGVLDGLGIEKAHVAGFSLGGLLGQTLALDWPERVDRLALFSAVAGRTEEERAKVVGRLEVIREEGIVAVTGAARERWFTPEFVAAHPERIDARIAELIANDKESYLQAYRVFGLGENAPRLHRIGHKTLVVTGENDVGSNPRMARFMHQEIANSRLVILPRLKHSLLVEAPELVAEQLLAFLREPD